jgi:hypothetical protein
VREQRVACEAGQPAFTELPAALTRKPEGLERRRPLVAVNYYWLKTGDINEKNPIYRPPQLI